MSWLGTHAIRKSWQWLLLLWAAVFPRTISNVRSFALRPLRRVHEPFFPDHSAPVVSSGLNVHFTRGDILRKEWNYRWANKKLGEIPQIKELVPFAKLMFALIRDKADRRL